MLTIILLGLILGGLAMSVPGFLNNIVQLLILAAVIYVIYYIILIGMGAAVGVGLANIVVLVVGIMLFIIAIKGLLSLRDYLLKHK